VYAAWIPELVELLRTDCGLARQAQTL
jgi:hypothetical protein